MVGTDLPTKKEAKTNRPVVDLSGRTMIDRETIHIHDVSDSPRPQAEFPEKLGD